MADEYLMYVLRDRIEQEKRTFAAEAVAKATATVAANATANTIHTMTERLIRKGMSGADISDVTGYDRETIDSIARSMQATVNWAQAGTPGPVHR